MHCHTIVSTTTLHCAQRLLQDDNSPNVSGADSSGKIEPSSDSTDVAPSGPLSEESSGGPSDAPDKPLKPIDRSSYGSASRRAGRNLKKLKDIPPVQLPQSFFDRNVILQENLQEANVSGQQTFIVVRNLFRAGAVHDGQVVVGPRAKDESEVDESRAGQKADDHPPVGKVDENILEEIKSMVLAGLQPSTSTYADVENSAKPHLVLHCPRKGSIQFLRALVKHLAVLGNADLIQIEAQDIAEIGGDYLDEPGDSQSENLSSLGYDVHAVANRGHESTRNPLAGEIARGDREENGDQSPKTIIINFMNTLKDIPKALNDIPKVLNLQKEHQKPKLFEQVMGPSVQDSSRDLKMSMFIDTLLHACNLKRALQAADNDKKGAASSTADLTRVDDASSSPAITLGAAGSAPVAPPALILQVDDYPEIYNTDNGGNIMNALHDALHERRKAGQRILLIGTCASQDHPLASADKGDLWEFDTGPTRTVVLPAIQPSSAKSFRQCHKKRNKAINTRHLQDMIRRLSSKPQHVHALISEGELRIDRPVTIASEMEERVWSSDRIHRIATVALGMMQDDEALTVKHLERALETIEFSDLIKHRYIYGSSTGETPSKGRTKRRQTAFNEYEKKLINGVVEPASIRTTFADVRAPKETIETLRTLASLSLVRPEAFTYGVLATDKIPGLLLYGPPGTGKTLLAKAVAKESGATVLEVSGAAGPRLSSTAGTLLFPTFRLLSVDSNVLDIHDKWVGESEKNIRAIFSLARKLKPCIVFIDEADAILGSRNHSNNRGSHRTVINQFLREWDGMNELSAFIMVATNRPFDLDEASLRRLPRRMLVDLPTEEDREEILKIHLKDERVDPEVSLAKLASETPLYSGSDLKNLAVAAALACVREEYNAAKAASKISPSTTSSIPLASTSTRRPDSSGVKNLVLPPSIPEPPLLPESTTSPSSSPSVSEPSDQSGSSPSSGTADSTKSNYTISAISSPSETSNTSPIPDSSSIALQSTDSLDITTLTILRNFLRSVASIGSTMSGFAETPSPTPTSPSTTSNHTISASASSTTSPQPNPPSASTSSDSHNSARFISLENLLPSSIISVKFGRSAIPICDATNDWLETRPRTDRPMATNSLESSPPPPPKRVLRPRHFAQAMQEISASI
ncbi:MAG: hypothetical protein Q9181_006333, partial [Wetmoreana brouardii]